MSYNPPSNGEACDVEGCELMQRADDTEATIRKRLSIYMDQTAPLIEYYESKGLIDRIDATQSIDVVRGAVEARLG
jgi:adenylate kinase